MPRQIQGSQTDFSFGEVDVSLKRADGHPARKGGLRQMVNARILNGGAFQNRPGRRALYPSANTRTEEFSMGPGSVYKIGFAARRLEIRNSAGVAVAAFTLQGNGANLPWVTEPEIHSIVFAVLNRSIYVTFAGMRPQVVTWNGVSTWTIADYNELLFTGQKRTAFYRISPQGITLLPGARTGAGVSLSASANIFTAQHVGTRIRYIDRQMLITGFTDGFNVTVTIQEAIPGHQNLGVAIDPRTSFSLSDVVVGGTTGSKGIIVGISAIAIDVQLISTNSTIVSIGLFENRTVSFVTGETLVGPAGSITIGSAGAIDNPIVGVTLWDEEVINDMRGYPASCFVDQFRIGFCNFPAVPGGIAWSAINSPNDLYVGANPSNAMFEIAPKKVQVYYVIPGPEGSEFVICDRALYYIPISVTNPLKPGSVAFNLLSGDGCAQVQPRLSQEAVLYVNAGQNSVMAVIATGAYNRPFNTKNLTDYHSHLFNNIACIAAPSADDTEFTERYVYVLNGDGSIAVGKYSPDSLQTQLPVIGWGRWFGAATVTWIAAFAADVIFSSNYFGFGVCEILDDTRYMDCSVAVNALPAGMAPPVGKGPLWFAPNQTVALIDRGTRVLGNYQVDANGFIVPQFNGGEDLTRAELDAGQPWLMTAEPFAPDATSGADVGQRMKRRSIGNLAVYVVNSTGFLIASLFSGKQTATSPALGTIMNQRRIPMWDQGEDVTLPPIQHETVEEWSPPGSTFDPRASIIKDSPGPLMILEIGMEISL